MRKSNKTKTASEWLTSGLVPEDRVDELVAASVLLAQGIALDARLADVGEQAFGADVEMAMVAAADEIGDVDLLMHIRDNGQHKSCAKQAKKVLYRAKQRGVAVPEQEQTREAVSLSRSPEPLGSWCSSFDRGGGQVVMWGGWSEDHGSWALLAVINDQRGLESVGWLPQLSRNRYRSVIDDLRERRSGELIEVSAAVAIDRVRWALQTAETQQGRIDGDKARVRRMLEETDASGQSVDAIASDEAAVTATSCEALLDDGFLEAWLMTLDGHLDLVESALKASVTSGELTVEGDAVQQAAVTTLVNSFDADSRGRLAGQLGVNALLIREAGRGEVAACAAAVANALAQEELSEAAKTFFAAVIDRLTPVDDLLRTLSEGDDAAADASAAAETTEPAPAEPHNEQAAAPSEAEDAAVEAAVEQAAEPAEADAAEDEAEEAVELQAPALEEPSVEAPALEAPALEVPALEVPALEVPAPAEAQVAEQAASESADEGAEAESADKA